MLNRLQGMIEGVKAADALGASGQHMDMPANQASSGMPSEPNALPQSMPAIPLALPVSTPVEGPIPIALPVPDGQDAQTAASVISKTPDVGAAGQTNAIRAPMPSLLCPFCETPRDRVQEYCPTCGLVFPTATATPATVPPPAGRLKGRYELGQALGKRGEVERLQAFDFGAGTAEPVPVIVVRVALTAATQLIPDEAAAIPMAMPADDDDILPSFEEPTAFALPITENLPSMAAWPSVAWEQAVLEKARHSALPAVLDSFTDDQIEYLVIEQPRGQPLWDAWDEPAATAALRFGWLKELADGLHNLHQAGAIVESLVPELIVVTATGRVRLTETGGLLPFPLPAGAPLRPSLYTAPELVLAGEQVDARADLYGFGALLYVLHVGRELTEMDFERPGVPKAFLPQFPDVHPVFGRLVTKTFCREVMTRFPTDEAFRDDPSGLNELKHTLEVCRQSLDNVRLDVAAWTTTGMVRTGNEDAFALLHAIDSRQDELGESVLVLLADGMGGYEAGEIAAAQAIQAMRRYLLEQKPFALLAGDTSANHEAFDLETTRQLLRTALREANAQIFTAARAGVGRRGMGCTAEAVYVNGRHVVIAHVGDSRTYHLHEGRLTQLTRDHTLVNRLVELGTLTPEEAAIHPRRSELQQALGGHADVDPALYHGTMKPGDWIVVCSDGLSNHITPTELQDMLLSEAASAEMAARRLVNFANIKGATDNASVVVVRAT
jgi:protein phosphatase